MLLPLLAGGLGNPDPFPESPPELAPIILAQPDDYYSICITYGKACFTSTRQKEYHDKIALTGFIDYDNNDQ